MSSSGSAQASSSKSGQSSFTTLRSAFDEGSPVFVATAIGTSTALAGTIGGIYAFSKTVNPFEGAAVLGGRYLMWSSGFFGLREYVISPILLSTLSTSQYTRRLEQLSDKQWGKLPSATPLNELWTERLLDSFLAGGMTLGAYSGLFRPSHSILKASLTGGLITTLGQLLVNSGRYARISYLSRSVSYADDADISLRDEPSLSQHVRQSFDQPTRAIQQNEKSLSGAVIGFMSYLMPINKMSTLEYLEKKQKERELLDKRLEAIEAEENRLYEFAQEQMRQRAARD